MTMSLHLYTNSTTQSNLFSKKGRSPVRPGAGSHGIKLRPHAAIFPPRGPSAVDKRPSRPFGLPSLTQNPQSISGWRPNANISLPYLKYSCSTLLNIGQVCPARRTNAIEISLNSPTGTNTPLLMLFRKTFTSITKICAQSTKES